MNGSQKLPLWAIRGLIRNDRMLVAHYVSWLRTMPRADTDAGWRDEHWRVVQGMHAAMQRIRARRDELRAILSPTASTDETLAGSLVTKSRAQSETPLHV